MTSGSLAVIIVSFPLLLNSRFYTFIILSTFSQAKIRELQVDLEKKLKKIPRRPRETIKELDDRAK